MDSIELRYLQLPTLDTFPHFNMSSVIATSSINSINWDALSANLQGIYFFLAANCTPTSVEFPFGGKAFTVILPTGHVLAKPVKLELFVPSSVFSPAVQQLYEFIGQLTTLECTSVHSDKYASVLKVRYSEDTLPLLRGALGSLSPPPYRLGMFSPQVVCSTAPGMPLDLVRGTCDTAPTAPLSSFFMNACIVYETKQGAFITNRQGFAAFATNFAVQHPRATLSTIMYGTQGDLLLHSGDGSAAAVCTPVHPQLLQPSAYQQPQLQSSGGGGSAAAASISVHQQLLQPSGGGGSAAAAAPLPLLLPSGGGGGSAAAASIPMQPSALPASSDGGGGSAAAASTPVRTKQQQQQPPRLA